MKHVRFFVVLILSAGILSVSSCNSGKDKKAEEPKMDSSAATKTETPVTAPSGPTSIMIVRHKVANYAKWKASYDTHDSMRLANGLHNYVIARGTKDSNTLLVAVRMDDVAKAKAFASSPMLKTRMKEGGVIGAPSVVDFLESVMNDTTAVQQTIRLMIRSNVKDWDAWKKGFDAHKQARIDAGLTDRVIAHTAGDTHNVTLVFAVADMDKANAFLKSQDLKDRMKESGVVGPPDMFFYRVVQKY
jgi:antibiotic biosynthesis monooxygenase (ABM) superfamily enzyme